MKSVLAFALMIPVLAFAGLSAPKNYRQSAAALMNDVADEAAALDKLLYAAAGPMKGRANLCFAMGGLAGKLGSLLVLLEGDRTLDSSGALLTKNYEDFRNALLADSLSYCDHPDLELPAGELSAKYQFWGKTVKASIRDL